MTARRSIFLLLVGIFWAGPALAQENQVSSEGVVIAAQSWEVTALVDARIKTLNFVEGQLVSKGDLLVELDSVLKAIEVELAENALQRTVTILKQREEDFSLQEKLKERNVASLATYSDAKFAVELAKTGLRAAELKLEVARVILGAHQLHAPATGLISAPRLVVGSNYDVDESGPIATIVQLDPINVRVGILLERMLTRLQEGTFTIEIAKSLKFGLELSNGTQYPLQGRVASMGFELDPDTGMGSLLVEFPNPKGVLRPGLPVVLTLQRE